MNKPAKKIECLRLLPIVYIAIHLMGLSYARGATISVTAGGTYQFSDHQTNSVPSYSGTDTSTQYAIAFSGNGFANSVLYEWSDVTLKISSFNYDNNLCLTTVGDQLPGGGTLTYPGSLISGVDLDNLPIMQKMTKIKPYCHSYTLSGSVRQTSEYNSDSERAQINPWLVIQNDDGKKSRLNLFGTSFKVPYNLCSAEVDNVDLGELRTGEHVTSELPVSVTSAQASKVVFTSNDLDQDGVLHLGGSKKILITTNEENIDGKGNWMSSEKNIPLRIQVAKDATPDAYTSTLIATVSCN